MQTVFDDETEVMVYFSGQIYKDAVEAKHFFPQIEWWLLLNFNNKFEMSQTRCYG